MIPHLIQRYDSLALGKNGPERVLNVVTDLPIDPATPGFNAETLHDFVTAVSALIAPGDYERATVHYLVPANA